MREFYKPENRKELEAALEGTIEASWKRCLEIWRNSSWRDESYALGGRVNDFPPSIRRTSNLPSRETMLGHFFNERFGSDYLFILDRFTRGTLLEQICAYDLLFFIAGDYFERQSPLPVELRDSRLPLPQEIRAELEDDINYSEVLSAYTLGEILSRIHANEVG